MFFDLDDLALAAQYTWHAISTPSGHAYARTAGRKPAVFFHTLLTGWTMVDHADRDPLNNRRANLRQTTHFDNARNRVQSKRNTTGFAGVVSTPTAYVACWREGKGSVRKSKLFSW